LAGKKSCTPRISSSLLNAAFIFLYLTGARGEDLDAEYWLKHIESFGGESPVIVVQNKIAQRQFEMNYRGLQARYPQIRGFVKTDCKDAIGLEELCEAIQQVIENMPEVRMLFPFDWLRVKYRLNPWKTNTWVIADFVNYVARPGVRTHFLKWPLICASREDTDHHTGFCPVEASSPSRSPGPTHNDHDVWTPPD
jgi:hypothetical protein